MKTTLKGGFFYVNSRNLMNLLNSTNNYICKNNWDYQYTSIH